MEESATQWLRKANLRNQDGTLDSMLKTELFDHTWIASIRQIEKHLRITDGMKILDAGCGWGRLIFGLKFFNPNIEITQEFVDKAIQLLTENNMFDNVSILEADLTTCNITDNYYDAFYSSRVLHYIEDKQLVLKKLYLSLKKGGRGLIIIPNRLNPYRIMTYKHAPLYPIRKLGRIMQSCGFINLKYGGFGFIPPLKRFSYKSRICSFEKILSSVPLLHYFGGLSYVTAQK